MTLEARLKQIEQLREAALMPLPSALTGIHARG
jgi:hypothetical protein